MFDAGKLITVRENNQRAAEARRVREEAPEWKARAQSLASDLQAVEQRLKEAERERDELLDAIDALDRRFGVFNLAPEVRRLYMARTRIQSALTTPESEDEKGSDGTG